MELKLMQLRKAAGYKSRDAFAAVIGVKPLTYKTWETGERNMNFAQACMVADALHCSLDELAGRTEFVGSYTDQRQAIMNEDYAHLSDAGKDAAAGAVRGIRASEGARVQTAGLEDHQIAATAYGVKTVADGLDFGGVDLSGINLSIAKQAEEWASIPMPPSKWELAAEAAEQREEQAELLAKLIERQDLMIEEQKRQAEEQRKAARGSKAREVAVIVLTALGIVVTLSLAVIPSIINTLAQ